MHLISLSQLHPIENECYFMLNNISNFNQNCPANFLRDWNQVA